MYIEFCHERRIMRLDCSHEYNVLLLAEECTCNIVCYIGVSTVSRYIMYNYVLVTPT